MLSNFLNALDAFHLLRPMWGFLFPVIFFIWWQIRKNVKNSDLKTIGIAEHLAKPMTLNHSGDSRWKPIDTTALALLLLAFAACGPTWSKAPNPFQSESAPMVVVMEVTRSMEAPDLQPSRLNRAKFKVLDIVERRVGARTAVIAYSGTAHRLAPLSEDPEILRTMLNALSPDIMPVKGNRLGLALEMAQLELKGATTPGTILLVTDGITESELLALEAHSDQTPVIVLFVAPKDEPIGLLEQASGISVIRLSADDNDINQIQQLANSAYQAALLGNEQFEWEDKGWLFAWLGALFVAFWFRQGWTVQWSLVLVTISLTSLYSPVTQAETIDYFLTQDQQAMLAYNEQNYQVAADKYQDPMWRAHALIRMGEFEAAAYIYSRIDTPEAAFAEGFCWQQAQRFKQSVRSFERAISLRADYPEAQHNLKLARAIAKLIESERERDGEGDQTGKGKGNPEDGGASTLSSTNEMSSFSSPQFTTTEEWMRAVDTDMADFLKARFSMEAQEVKQ